MTNQQVYDYVDKNVSEHGNYIADDYVKAGYGQIRGGYFEEAYKRDKKIWKVEAEPSQKWHLLVSYYEIKKEDPKFDMQGNASLGRLMCPQLMMWLAQVAGLNEKIIKDAMNKAIAYEEKYKTKDSRKIKKDVLIEALYWEKISQIITQKDTWKEVEEEISAIR